jgi:hypothetical protein
MQAKEEPQPNQWLGEASWLRCNAPQPSRCPPCVHCASPVAPRRFFLAIVALLCLPSPLSRCSSPLALFSPSPSLFQGREHPRHLLRQLVQHELIPQLQTHFTKTTHINNHSTLRTWRLWYDRSPTNKPFSDVPAQIDCLLLSISLTVQRRRTRASCILTRM